MNYLNERLEQMLDDSMAMNIYEEHGYKSRRDYLECLSDDYNVPLEVVEALANLLTPLEDFDGLVTAVEMYE